MTIAPRYPSLYQLNTRVWLRRLSREHGKHVTLAEIDDAAIDGFARQGFDWIWLLSVWRTGPAGRLSREATQSGEPSSKPFCPTSARTTYAAPASRSWATS
jgi:hypothetical protein